VCVCVCVCLPLVTGQGKVDRFFSRGWECSAGLNGRPAEDFSHIYDNETGCALPSLLACPAWVLAFSRSTVANPSVFAHSALG
jgi:hypothetical protein